MNIKALAVIGFSLAAPAAALGQTVTQDEVDFASAQLCKAYSAETMKECVQHMSDDQYAQVARNVVLNRCGGKVAEAARLAVKRDHKAAVSKHYDASDCAIQVMMGTEDKVLQDEAQLFSIKQRAAAAALSRGVKAALR